MSSYTMTLHNPSNSIISQAITSAVDGVLAKSQHKLQGLLHDLCEATALVFIQQQQRLTTQSFEEDDEDDVISNNLFAETKHIQHQLHELEDPHDQIRDFVGEPIYDDYDYDSFREPRHNSEVMAQEGDMSSQINLLSPMDSHEINDDITNEPLLDRPIFISNVESYYVAVTNLPNGPIYDVSEDGVSTESYYYKDTPCSDGDQGQRVNNGCNGQVVVDDAYISVKKQYMNYGLGKKDCHRQSLHKQPGRDRDKGHTFADLVATRKILTSGPKSTKLLEETRRILKLDHETCFTELSLMEKQALDNKIIFCRVALALEKERNKNLGYGMNDIKNKIRMLNKGSASLDMILSRGRTEKSTMGLGYQGDTSNSQTIIDRTCAEQKKTRVDLDDEFSDPLEWIDSNRCLQTKTMFSMEPVYSVCKEEVRIQDESNDFDVQQREYIKLALSSCGIGANKRDKKIEVLPSYDIVKLASMDKKRNGHMTLIGTSALGSFSLLFSGNITSGEEEAMGYTLASVFFCMQEADKLTAYHEKLLSFWHKKSETLGLVLVSCCSTFYRTGVVVLKTTAALVFIHAPVSLHVSFSWIIHMTGTLKRVAASQTTLQRRLTIFVTRYRCVVLQPSIIWEPWIWIFPSPLVDDASNRESEKTKSKDARREETPTLAVMECLNLRASHVVLVLPRFVVHIFLKVCGDVLYFLSESQVPRSHYQVLVLFICQRCSMDREKCNFSIIYQSLFIKGHLGFYGQHRCARLVCFLSSLQSYLWCFAYVLHCSVSSPTGGLQVSSNYQDSTLTCWSDFSCISSKSLFGSLFGAARECLYFAVLSFGRPLVDLFHLIKGKVRGFNCDAMHNGELQLVKVY